MPFPEPVTVKLRHHVPTYKDEETLAMSLVIAETAQELPYILFQQLSGIVIGYWVPVSTIYLQNSMTSFVVIKNLQPHNYQCE